MKAVSIFKKFLKIILLISIIALIFSYFAKNTLPKPNQIINELDQAPKQTELLDLDKQPFTVKKGDFTYQITPQYDYEIYGLVVTEHDSNSWIDIYHKNDPFNTKDVCLMWGSNLQSGVYEHMKFSSGDWTCYFNFKNNADPSWYNKFNREEGSNNHLLPASDRIEKLIRTISRGDQIHIKGKLVNYTVSSPEKNEGHRNTSTVRDDDGCEIVYVEDVQILNQANTIYHTIFTYSEYLILFSFVLLVVCFIIWPMY